MTSQPAGPDLAAIASAASRETGGVPVGLLGDYLPAVAEAAARSGPAGCEVTKPPSDGPWLWSPESAQPAQAGPLIAGFRQFTCLMLARARR